LYLVIQDQKLGTAQIRKKLAYYAGFENIFKCEKNDKKTKTKLVSIYINYLLIRPLWKSMIEECSWKKSIF